MVSETGTQCSSSDLQQYNLGLSDVYWLMCQKLGLDVVLLTSSSTYLASVMFTDFMYEILGLNVVVLTSSSIYLASVMCTDIIVSDFWTQCSSTDL